MKREIKIIIAGVIIFLFLLTVAFVSLIYKKEDLLGVYYGMPS